MPIPRGGENETRRGACATPAREKSAASARAFAAADLERQSAWAIRPARPRLARARPFAGQSTHSGSCVRVPPSLGTKRSAWDAILSPLRTNTIWRAHATFRGEATEPNRLIAGVSLPPQNQASAEYHRTRLAARVSGRSGRIFRSLGALWVRLLSSGRA